MPLSDTDKLTKETHTYPGGLGIRHGVLECRSTGKEIKRPEVQSLGGRSPPNEVEAEKNARAKDKAANASEQEDK